MRRVGFNQVWYTELRIDIDSCAKSTLERPQKLGEILGFDISSTAWVEIGPRQLEVPQVFLCDQDRQRVLLICERKVADDDGNEHVEQNVRDNNEE
jgi:hypothetical protein